MPQSPAKNRRLILAERPRGEPDENTMRLETVPVPEPGKGQVLIRNEFLSLDPYMRGRMSDGESYADPVELGDVMVGGTVGQIVTSNLDGFAPGDWVSAFGGWQDYAISDGNMLINMGKSPENPSWALGVLGMPGLTAWSGLTQIGKPEKGETLVVAGATGPVGSAVGQIGKILGLDVIGIAGGPVKCAYVRDELGFDDCIDYKAEGFADSLSKAVPGGIDIYFENVGGAVFDAVLPNLNTLARVPVCGLISQYNATSLPEGPDRTGMLMGTILRKRLLMRGFLVYQDFGHLYPEFADNMTGWVHSSKVKYREELIEGLEQAPSAFAGLLRGEAFGKRVVRLSS